MFALNTSAAELPSRFLGSVPQPIPYRILFTVQGVPYTPPSNVLILNALGGPFPILAPGPSSFLGRPDPMVREERNLPDDQATLKPRAMQPESEPDDPVAGPSFVAQAADSAARPDPTQASWISLPRNPGLGGILSEVRAGVLDHDFGVVSSATENGVDANLEALFNSPDFLRYILSPRPHLGASINSDGNTSQAYFGLTWTADIYDDFFVEFAFGGSVHNGDLVESSQRNGLGCSLLFREAISAGYLFEEKHSLSIMFDHISNAGFCPDNDGQDNFGVRYGYRF